MVLVARSELWCRRCSHFQSLSANGLFIFHISPFFIFHLHHLLRPLSAAQRYTSKSNNNIIIARSISNGQERENTCLHFILGFGRLLYVCTVSIDKVDAFRCSACVFHMSTLHFFRSFIIYIAIVYIVRHFIYYSLPFLID